MTCASCFFTEIPSALLMLVRKCPSPHLSQVLSEWGGEVQPPNLLGLHAYAKAPWTNPNLCLGNLSQDIWRSIGSWTGYATNRMFQERPWERMWAWRKAGTWETKPMDSPELWGEKVLGWEEGGEPAVGGRTNQRLNRRMKGQSWQIGGKLKLWGYIISQDLYFILYILYKNIYYYLISL